MTKENETSEKAGIKPDYGQNRTLAQLASQFFPPIEFNIESLTLFEPKNDIQTLSTYLNSVYWKLGLADYHVSKALSAIPSVIPNDEPNKGSAASAIHMALMRGHHDEEVDRMEIAMLETEAHGIAAAQALDSVPDILSQALYLALRLDLKKPMLEGLRTVQSVTQALEDAALNSVSTGLKELVNSETFEYLRAFVNTTKHRSLIDNLFHRSLVDSEDYGLTICAFRYEERSGKVKGWPSKTFKEFLEYTAVYMSAAVGAILRTAEGLLASFAGWPAERFWFKLEKI